jgi:hypothetical protein
MRLLDPLCATQLSFSFSSLPPLHTVALFDSALSASLLSAAVLFSLLAQCAILSFNSLDFKRLPFYIAAGQISLASCRTCALQ